jgi:hypothetical protein
MRLLQIFRLQSLFRQRTSIQLQQHNTYRVWILLSMNWNNYVYKKQKNQDSEMWNLFFSNGRCDSNESPRVRVSVIATVACGSFLFTVTVGVIFVCIYRKKSMPRGRFDGKGHQLTESESADLFSDNWYPLVSEILLEACIYTKTWKRIYCIYENLIL